jgi:HEAT repeat protein
MRHALLVVLLTPALAICQTTPATAPASGSSGRDQQCQDILEKALQDKNPDTRKQAAIALSLAGSTEPFPSELETMLDDKDVEVRLAAISSLAEIKNGRTVAALHKALNDDVPEVSFAAARALWALNDPEGKKVLLSVLSGETKASSGYIAKQKRDALRMLHTPKTTLLFAVKQGAGLTPIPGLGQGVSSMEALLSDPSVSGRATAALLLENDKDAATLAALKGALTDKDWSVRAAGVHALVLRDDPAFQADIVPLLDDKNEGVRLRAAAGYMRLEDVKSKPNTVPRKRRVTKTGPAKAQS